MQAFEIGWTSHGCWLRFHSRIIQQHVIVAKRSRVYRQMAASIVQLRTVAARSSRFRRSAPQREDMAQGACMAPEARLQAPGTPRAPL